MNTFTNENSETFLTMINHLLSLVHANCHQHIFLGNLDLAKNTKSEMVFYRSTIGLINDGHFFTLMILTC